MIIAGYFMVGAVVATIALIILCKMEPPFDGEKPDFEEFLFIVGMIAFMFAVGVALWPIVVLVGSLWLLWRALWREREADVSF